jgi:chloride channel 3/4/5
MYIGGVCDAGLFGIRDIFYQKYYSSEWFTTLGAQSLIFAQPLVIASGLSVGKEGPSVHVACCIGSLVAGLFGKFQRSQGKLSVTGTSFSS